MTSRSLCCTASAAQIAAFPDLRLSVEDIVDGGGKVVARVRLAGLRHSRARRSGAVRVDVFGFHLQTDVPNPASSASSSSRSSV